MMNVSTSTKTNNTDSPKTPGGISKCYLTPCRRVGLSRKWKKGGVSPFVSPLTSSESNKEDKHDSVVRKRKKCNVDIEEKDEDRATSQGSLEEVSSEPCSTPKIDVDRTPTRVILPRKKSKILITTHASQENVEKVPQSIVELNSKKIESNDEKIQEDCPQPDNILSNCILDVGNQQQSSKEDIKVSKLSRKNSKSSFNKPDTVESPKREPSTNRPLNRPSNNKNNSESINSHILESEKSGCNVSIKEKSPNNLTKECIVVIQKKIFKTDKKPKNASTKNVKEIIPTNKSSQTLFDSDTDDLPLCNLNKIEKECNTKEQKTLNETNISLVSNVQNITDLTKKEVDESDFVEKKKVNVKKVERTTSTTGLKNKAKEKHKSKLKIVKSVPKSSQSSNSDDDDFDYGKKSTILKKKTYDKVSKPVKAKSTGSITQKDIDDLKATIEYKKKLLLAKSMTEETEELRELIKKWKVGCQTVLMELVDLMKKKMPDQNMECSELLHLLKIPPKLVGYDSDNDSFITPDDTAIILSALKLFIIYYN